MMGYGQQQDVLETQSRLEVDSSANPTPDQHDHTGLGNPVRTRNSHLISTPEPLNFLITRGPIPNPTQLECIPTSRDHVQRPDAAS
jgi:hypothetical protein